MGQYKKIEVFSAGCLVCDLTVNYVKLAIPKSCEFIVLDTNKNDVAKRAIDLGIRCLPAIVVDGKLADECLKGGPSRAFIRSGDLSESRDS